MVTMGDPSSASTAGPFAVVGYAFKLPQEAENETGFWEILEDKKNVMTEWPKDRISVDGFDDGGVKRPNMVCPLRSQYIRLTCN